MQADPSAELAFRAMGSDCHVVAVGSGAEEIAELGRRRIADLERKWSRFRPDSELSRLNELAGRPVIVSADVFRLVERAIDAWWRSAGRFDPTVRDALIANGYDRDFQTIAASDIEAPGCPGVSPERTPAPGCVDVDLDSVTSAVTLPVGVAIDPGGIGKGLAADMVTHEMTAAGASGSLANLGGDIRVRGSSPTGAAWPLAIEDPTGERAPVGIEVADGAVVTSSALRRRWTNAGVTRHHLIDPATGSPTTTDVVAATVIAATGAWAEVETKILFTAGVSEGLDLLRGAEAIVYDAAGDRHWTTQLEGVLS